MTSLGERFWSKVDCGDGCWEWTAARHRSGYGVFQLGVGRQISAHRQAWVLARGAIPEGLWVLHHCDNRGCVRPEHLYVGTPGDNARDREERCPTSLSNSVTCALGHAYTAENTYQYKRQRWCRACGRIRARRYRNGEHGRLVTRAGR